MSLQFQTISSYLKPFVNVTEEQKEDLREFAERVNILQSDVRQIQYFDIYEVLFSKVRSASVTVSRSERIGIYIGITYIVVPNIRITLVLDRKKHRDIRLNIQNMEDQDESMSMDPSGFLQKLLISRLPKRVANVLMYYIYNPEVHDWVDIEQYEGPVEYDESEGGNFELKIKTNYPDNWRMNNKWEEISNFVFSLIEAVNHTKYDEGFDYPFTLDLNVCKEMCREEEESIVVKRKFKRSY